MLILKTSHLTSDCDSLTLPETLDVYADGTVEAQYIDRADDGYPSLEQALEVLGLQRYVLAKHADPVEGARVGLTVAEALEVAREDRSLIYLARPLPLWSDLFLLVEDDVLPAADFVADMRMLRRTGSMLGVFGPYASREDAQSAAQLEDPSGTGLRVDEIDWTGVES